MRCSFLLKRATGRTGAVLTEPETSYISSVLALVRRTGHRLSPRPYRLVWSSTPQVESFESP